MGDHENANKRLAAMRADLMTFGARYPDEETSDGDVETARKILVLADQVLFAACCEPTRIHALAIIARARSFVAIAGGESIAALHWATVAREFDEEHDALVEVLEKVEAAAVEAFVGPRPPPEEMN